MRLEQCPLPGGGSLTVYLRDAAQAMPNALCRPVVVVVPGGGYNHVSAREADPVALQFAAAGYHTAILTYRVGEGARHYQPLRQLNAAIGLLRSRAEAWNLLPEKIAVCGFSAGGHLALSGAVLDLPDGTPMHRPNAVLLAYHHGRGICPPGQFCPAGGQRRPCRPTAVHAGGQDHTGHTAGLRLAYHGGPDGARGKHPPAADRSAPGRRAL